MIITELTMQIQHTGRSGFSSSLDLNELVALLADDVFSRSFDVGLYSFEPSFSELSSPCHIVQQAHTVIQ